jgi:hypothetical protein
MTSRLPETRTPNSGSRPSAGWATFWYTVLALLMTWPLVTGLARDIPWDLGDSVLNCWILQWGADHCLRFLAGDFGAFRGYFNANIFYPEPLALAYSEHLTAQVIQILPVYALTRNIVLSYNLLFLSTFVVSGLGTFLLVRELTGSARAGFVAGLLYAFAPYRTGQFSHLQVLSSQWMPFVLYGFRRYFVTRRPWPLAGAALALAAQNLSCGYFLLYFTPFVAAYVIYEIADRGIWRSGRTWAELCAAAAAVAAVTIPFLLPYLAVREHGFGPRPPEEVARYSADVYSYLTAHVAQLVWGGLVRAFPKGEGELFPAVIPTLLALIGIAAHARITWAVTRARGADPDAPRWRRLAIYAAILVFAWGTGCALVILARGGLVWRFGPLVVRIHDLARALRLMFAASAVLALASPRARAFVRGVPGSAVAFYVAALALAFWLSLGPAIFTMGTRIADGSLYAWLYRHVPGFDGLRVPSRMGMLVALFLAVLGGYGARAVERTRPGFADDVSKPRVAPARRSGRRGSRPIHFLAAASVAFLVEAAAVPLEMNGTWPVASLQPAPVPLIPAGGPPAIYLAVRTLPPRASIAEFPFGDEQYDLRYMVWSASHGHALLNGYSGGFPRSYAVNRAGLGRVLDDPGTAWRVLSGSGATHALVHEGLYLGDDGVRVSGWLLAHGATEAAASGTDRLFALPR